MFDDPQLVVLLTGTLIVLALRWLLDWRIAPEGPSLVREMLADALESMSQLARVHRTSEGHLELHEGETVATVRLAQAHRRCGEFPEEVGAVVRDAAQAVYRALPEADGLPGDWRDRVQPLLVDATAETPPDAVLEAGPADLRVGYALDGEGSFRWLARAELDAAGVTTDEVAAMAHRNLVRSCAGLVIEPLGAGEGSDGAVRFNTGDALDASRVLLPDFHGRFAPRFGDELIVAIPTRDLLVLTGARDAGRTGFLAWRARMEFGRRAYPVCDRLLRITDEGVGVWVGREEPMALEV